MRPIVTDNIQYMVVYSVYMYTAWSVGGSVGHSSELCKTAELIDMLFGSRTRVGPRNHVLDMGPDPS